MTDLVLVNLQRQFEPLTQRLAAALSAPGVSVTASQLIMSVITSVERNPTLLECSRQSLFQAAMSAAWLGLPCDGVTGQSFIIPFKKRAQLVVGYKGFNTLAARSGITITGEVVRASDEFDFDEGEGFVRHKKSLTATNATILGVWAKAAALDRPAVVKVLALADILAVKARAPGAARTDSPWNDPAIGFPAMAEKTAKRRLARNLPLNVMTTAARLSEAHEEQGAHAWINEGGALQIDTVVEADAQQPPTEALVAPPAKTATQKLHDASRQGMDALEEAWNELPREEKTALKAELESIHKPQALKARHEDRAP